MRDRARKTDRTDGMGRRPKSGRSQKPVGQCIFDQLRRGPQIQLLHNLRFVKLDRAGGNLEAERNVLHRTPLCQ